VLAQENIFVMAEKNIFQLPDLTIVGCDFEPFDNVGEEPDVQQLIWHLTRVCTRASGETLLSKLIAESYTLVGFGPISSMLRGQ
jgi:hypothetical protein